MLHFERTDEAMQRRFLDLFLQFGTREGRNSTELCNITDALTDGHWFITYCNFWPHPYFSNVPAAYEFIVTGENAGGVVCCKILTENTHGGYQYTVTELGEIRGNVPLSREQLTEMLLTYERMSIQAQSWMYPAEDYSGRFFRQLWEKYFAKRKLILENPAPWAESGELLALPYEFCPSGMEEYKQFTALFRQYRILADDIEDLDAAEAKVKIRFALTNPERSFLLAQGAFIDQYAYEVAVLTASTAGVVSVWFDAETHIRDIRGSIPFPEKELGDMLLYYHSFSTGMEQYFAQQ